MSLQMISSYTCAFLYDAFLDCLFESIGASNNGLIMHTSSYLKREESSFEKRHDDVRALSAFPSAVVRLRTGQ